MINSGLEFDGRYSWTLQTYLHLKQAHSDVFLTDSLPDRGIIIAHRDFLPDSLNSSGKCFLVAIKPDRLPHPFAQLHIVQSLCDPMLAQGNGYCSAFFIPSWPQPDLISREIHRGSRFENVRFFGRSEHLADELTQIDLGAALDLNWRIMPLSEWQDYRETDLVIAIRYFGKEPSAPRAKSEDPKMKPFAKLVNCWLAGVPAILGHEPAYLSIRRNKLDYIEADSLTKLIESVSLLKNDSKLRDAMVLHGRARAVDFSVESIKKRWMNFLDVVLPLKLKQWQEVAN